MVDEEQMRSDALRLYGKNDVQIDRIDLPPLQDGEVLLRVKSATICTSCHKTTVLAEEHHRVPTNLAETPIILGHEFAGVVVDMADDVNSVEIGKSYIVQPMVYGEENEALAVGHSYPYLGGYATYVIVPQSIVKSGGLIEWKGEGFYKAALSEPLACIIAAWRAQYHTVKESYKPIYGHKKDGITLLLGGTGAMGLFTILLWKIRASENSKLIIYSRNQEKLNSIATEFSNDKRIFVISDKEKLISNYKELIDDVVVFVPSKETVELGLSLLAYDGCLNMFAGPFDENFTASVNFHSIHYKRHHIVGSSGASREDFEKAISLLENGKLNPSYLITHIGGLSSVGESVKNLPNIGGGKKLIYPHIDFPLTAISDIDTLAENDSRFVDIAQELKKSNGVWNEKAEKIILSLK